MRRPSFFILIAALWFLFIIRPQSHLYTLSTSASFFCLPQQLQSCDEGYHLSTLTGVETATDPDVLRHYRHPQQFPGKALVYE